MLLDLSATHLLSKIVFKNFDANDEVFIISIDGTHCRTSEPRTHPSTRHCSHKSNGPGLAYELALAIHSNQLVWINGGFMPADHDLTIYRKPDGLKQKMVRDQPGKRAIADEGYRGEPGTISTRNDFDSDELRRFKRRVKARQETFNRRIKVFGVLAERFRHVGERRVECHKLAFTAACILVQYEIEGGHPLFDV